MLSSLSNPDVAGLNAELTEALCRGELIFLPEIKMYTSRNHLRIILREATDRLNNYSNLPITRENLRSTTAQQPSNRVPASSLGRGNESATRRINSFSSDHLSSAESPLDNRPLNNLSSQHRRSDYSSHNHRPRVTDSCLPSQNLQRAESRSHKFPVFDEPPLRGFTDAALIKKRYQL